MSTYAEPNTSTRILMGPGPSDAHPRVLKAMATPLIGHLDPEFLHIMDEIKEMVQLTFQTKNQLTFVVSAPGSAGMETCLVNLLEPGDEAVICINGVFGTRMADIAERCGAKVIRVNAPWGEPIPAAAVEEALASRKPKLVSIVHAETSTGVRQPLEEISSIVHKAGALFVVDAVTSWCGIPVKVDEWEIDAIYSGSQKCLSAPPGLSPVSAMFAMHEALRLVLEEGLDHRFARHATNHELLRDGLEELGFEFMVKPEFRLPMLNTVKLPATLTDATHRKQLLDEFNIEVGGGLGDFAGKIWRIGLMGNSSSANHVNVLLGALRSILNH